MLAWVNADCFSAEEIGLSAPISSPEERLGGVGGRRSQAWRNVVGEIVMRPCLKAYFDIDMAQTAGWGDVNDEWLLVVVVDCEIEVQVEEFEDLEDFVRVPRILHG